MLYCCDCSLVIVISEAYYTFVYVIGIAIYLNKYDTLLEISPKFTFEF